jgi:hypothetical protein
MQKRVLFYALGCLVSFNVLGQYTYEANQDLYDLNANANNFNGELAYEVSDDGISPAIDLSFNFTFYGSTFSQARMATNGCLHFGNSGSYCNDYTPDPINGQHTYTIYPFWTDLIRDSDSRMKSWGDSSKMIFGWYNLREYNRASDNSFEIILWNNNSFDLRYGELDIINHDVLIGEVGANKDNSYTYYYHDECNTGSTNTSSCYNYDWNNSDKNTNLENGGSLFGWGSGSGLDCSNPLNDATCPGYDDAYQTQQCDIDQLYSESCSGYAQAYQTQQCDIDQLYSESCSGYAQAYQTQQCDIDQLYSEECPYYAETYLSQQCDITDLYSESCPNYWDAYDDQQCEEDPQYAPFCAGYRQEESVAFFDDTNVDYGYEEEMFPSYEQFDSYEPEEVVIFFDPEPLPFIDTFSPLHDEPLHQDEVLIDEFIFQETFLVEDYNEPETFIEFDNVEELEEWFEEEINERFEERIEEEFADLAEPEEEFIEEIFEEEAVEEVFEAIEERITEAEIEEERIEREEVFEEEFEIAERENTRGKSSISRDIALRVVSSTIATATQSVSGTTAGNSIHATGNSAVSGNVVSNSSTGASSGNAGISTSSSPSMSDQFASATVQTNQVLDMSSMSVSSSSTSDSMNATDVNTSVVVANVNTNTVQDQIDTSISSMSTSSDTDTTVEDVIAQNLQTAQEEVEAQQEETGEYGSEDTIIAYMGFVPGFNTYEKVLMVDQDQWYTSRTIYTETMPDNINAFYGLAGSNISKMNDIINSQPPL